MIKEDISIFSFKNGIFSFFLYVIPKSAKNDLKIKEGKIFCYIKAKPIDQLGNKNIIEFLSDILYLQKKQVVIKSGLRSKMKKIQILDVVEENIKKRILEYLNNEDL